MPFHIKVVLNDGRSKTENDTLPFVFGVALCGSVVFRGSGPLDGYFKLVWNVFYLISFTNLTGNLMKQICLESENTYTLKVNGQRVSEN
jgi:hypothetical protein